MKNVLLAKYGEIALRGKNRYLFENALIRTIKKNIEQYGDFFVIKEQGRILIENSTGDIDYELILPKLQTILGIVGFCLCVKTENQNVENLQEIALSYMDTHYKNKNISFKVETKRADKRYPLDSRQVSAIVGGYIFTNRESFSVNVKNPDVQLMIELRNNAYIYSKIIKGFCGLPTGSSGKGLLLLSGGIDSPVSGFLMAKRGVQIEAVYFHSPPFTSERALEKVQQLARRLYDFTGYIKLHVVNFTEIQTYLYEKVPQDKLTVFLKRAMIKCSDIIGRNLGSHCLITGDSVGQVASQTMQAILAIDSSSKLPIFRPLCGLDKNEIIEISNKIGTYEISIQPYEDCCTLFVAKHPETRPKASIIEKMESNLTELDSLINYAVDNKVVYEF